MRERAQETREAGTRRAYSVIKSQLLVPEGTFEQSRVKKKPGVPSVIVEAGWALQRSKGFPEGGGRRMWPGSRGVTSDKIKTLNDSGRRRRGSQFLEGRAEKSLAGMCTKTAHNRI